MTSNIENFTAKTQVITESFKKEASAVRANRPTTAMFDTIKVNYYDQLNPLKQLATVSVAPPREVLIHVWDKGAVASVAKAIETSGLGFSANIEGNVIRIFLPELSHERREELIKYIKSVGEKHRIQLRHARDEANKEIQKQFDEKLLTEDQKFSLKNQIQKETDNANITLEKIVEGKMKEIME